MITSPTFVILDGVLIDSEVVVRCIATDDATVNDIGVSSETFADLKARKAMPLPARLSCSAMCATSPAS